MTPRRLPSSKSARKSRPTWSRTVFRVPAAVTFSLLGLGQYAVAANTEYDVINGKTDLTAAATYTTGGTAGTGAGGTAATTGPTVTSDVTFDSGTAYSPAAFTLNSSQTFGSLNDLSATVLTIANTSTTGTGDTLTLGGGGDPGSSVPGATAGDLIFVGTGANLSINSGAAGTATALGLVLGQSGNFDNVGTLSISAVISDGGNGYSITKNGVGTLSLSGANTFSGGIFLNAGQISTGNASGLGAGMFTLGGVGSSTAATLQLSAITVNNAFTINAGGTRTIYQGSSNSTIAGLVTFVSGATLDFGPNGGGNIALTGGTAGTGSLIFAYFQSGRSGESVNISGAAVNQTGTITDAFGNTSFTGSAAGPGNVNISANITANVTNVIVNGPGTVMTLSGTDSFQAGTVTQGTLDYQVAAALPSSGTTTVATAGSLVLGVGSAAAFTSANVDSLFANTLTGVSLAAGSGIGLDTTPGNFTYATNQSTARTFTKLGANSLILTGANNFYNGITVSAGTLQLGNGTAGSDGSLGLTPVIVNNAAVAFSTNSAQSFGGIMGGTGTLTKSGAGTLTLSVANFFTGNTTVSAGTLDLSNSQALQNSALQTGGTGLVFDSSVTSHSFVIGGLNGGTTLALADNAATPNAVALTLHPNSSVTDTYNLALTGAGSLTVAGVGTQVLGGTNTYTGGTTVSLGTLKLDFTQTGAPASNILYNGVTQTSTQSLTMGGVGASTNADGVPGANLLVAGKNSATSTQTFYGLTLNPGVSNITITPGTGTAAVQLNFTNGLSHNAGGVINFTDTQSTTNFISLGNGSSTGTLNDATGIIGGYATVNGTAYASVSANGQVVPYTYTTTVGTTGAIADSGATTATNVELTGATGTETLSGTSNGATNINTLTNAGTGAQTVNVAAGTTLRLGVNGGILQSSGQNLTIGSTAGTGTLTAGGNAYGTAGEISLVSRNSSTITVNSVIANNNASTGTANSTGGGAVTLTIGESSSGATTYVSLGSNTYSGGTYLDGSRVSAGSVTSFGTGQVTVLPGAQAFLGASGTYANTFNIAGIGANETGFGVAIRFVNNAATTLSGTVNLLGDSSIISNAGDALTGNLTGTGSLNIFGNTSTFTVGSTTAGTSTTDTITGNLSVNGFVPGVPNGTSGVTLKLGGTGALPNGVGSGNVILNGGNLAAGTNTTLDVNGFSASTNGLISAGANVASSVVTNSGVGANLTIGDNNANASFGGRITDSGATTAANILAITKAGTGVQVFSGANTYNGTTTVNAGALVYNGNLTPSVAGGSAMTVGSTTATTTPATLGGTGVLTVTSVTVNGNGTLAPGATLGATTGALTLNTTSGTTINGTLAIGIAATGGSALVTTGALTLGSGSTLTVTGTSGAADYDIANYAAGTLTGTFTTMNIPSGYAINYAGSHFSGTDIELDAVTSVPEPSTVWAGVLMLMVGAGWYYRRERRSARG